MLNLRSIQNGGNIHRRPPELGLLEGSYESPDSPPTRGAGLVNICIEFYLRFEESDL